MRAFITGASGFVGTYLVKRLKQEAWDIATYDSATGGNICDTLLLQDRLEAADPDIVFHLAAIANVRRASDEAVRVFEVNTRGTHNVLEAMRTASCKCKRIVFTSSCSVYGEPTQFPTTEDTPMPVQTSLYEIGRASCRERVYVLV